MGLQFNMGTKRTCLMTYFLLNVAISIEAVVPVCSQDDPFGWIRHPTDCGRYYRCSFKKPIEMPSCKKGMVFSNSAKTCVKTESQENDCQNEALTVEERCQRNNSATFPHPGECQLYYNCTNTREPDQRSYFKKYMEECTYPQLFSAITSRCERYDVVECGQRTEYVDPCDYYRNKCLGHCSPCSVRWVRCIGLPDGENPHLGRLWSPYYGVCLGQRTIAEEYCAYNDTLGIFQLFSPDLRRCVSLYEIPREHGGYYLNCTQRADGLYADDVTSRPDIYFQCENGLTTSIERCPQGSMFQPTSASCAKSAVENRIYA